MVLWMVTFWLLLPAVCFGAALDQSKIIAPSSGIYLGAYEWTAGDIAAVESSTGYTLSHYASQRGSWAIGYVSGHPHLDVTAANVAWAAGKAIVVQAYNLYAGTDDEHPSGFTVDKLLAGDYDSNLSTFAAELRSFGKPLWMQAGREPNGAGQDYMCGFGTTGTTSLAAAIAANAAYNQFTPPSPPSGAPADLYTGLTGATKPDGIARCVAGQRYLHDFFERRENLHFLTWDSKGYSVRYYKDATDNQEAYDSADYAGNEAYALTLLQRCSDPANWYPGDDYTDWVSGTLYFLDYYDANWSFLSGSDILIPNADWLASLVHWYTAVQAVTSKPIILVELGFPDGMSSNTAYGASKVTSGMTAILDTYTQIKAISLWSNHASWMVNDVFPYDCLFDNPLQVTALQTVVSARPGALRSCVTLTDGAAHPNCVSASSPSGGQYNAPAWSSPRKNPLWRR